MKQIEFIGKGEINKIRDILCEYNPNNVFLVTGKNSYEQSGAKVVLDDLLSKYNKFHFNNFENNPKLYDIKKGISLFRENNCDLVLAIGGGRVIDIAKAINILSVQQGNPEEYIRGIKKIETSSKPLIAIPTTSGSGSEATHFTVVYINKEKYSLASPFILPNYSIVDPNLTLSLPKDVTASTGMDALSQAIESYWAVGSTDESKLYAKKAIELILKNLEKAANNSTIDSRIVMSEAAHLAGKAINISKTTASHAISYFFTSHYGIPHGHAVSLTLGQMFVYNNLLDTYLITDVRGKDYVKITMQELYKILNINTSEEAHSLINDLMRKINLETHLSELKIDLKKDINKVIESVNIERLSNNPVKLDSDAIRQILINIC